MQRGLPAFLKSPFIVLLLVFATQGLLLWAATLLHPSVTWAFASVWLGVYGGIVSWWILWPALHPARGWQPWVECLGLMAATYAIPLAFDPLFRVEDGKAFIPPSVVLRVGLYSSVFSVLPSALALRGLFQLFKLRLRPAKWSPWSSARSMLLAMLVLGIHLAVLGPNLSLKLSDVWQVLIWSWQLLPAEIIVLAITLMTMKRRTLATGCLMIGGVSLAGLSHGLFEHLLLYALTVALLLAHAWAMALLLCRVGYRIGIDGEELVTAPQPLQRPATRLSAIDERLRN